MPPQVHFLDPSTTCLYRPLLMQKAQGKCCENQPLSRNRKSRNTAFLPKPEPAFA